MSARSSARVKTSNVRLYGYHVDPVGGVRISPPRQSQKQRRQQLLSQQSPANQDGDILHDEFDMLFHLMYSMMVFRPFLQSEMGKKQKAIMNLKQNLLHQGERELPHHGLLSYHHHLLGLPGSDVSGNHQSDWDVLMIYLG